MRASRMEESMRGQIVVCKDFISDELIRLVWEDSEALIFVHTEDQFKAHEDGLPHLEPVGFPIEDVFMRDDGTGDLVPYALSRLQSIAPS